jgi:hypothetical protein
MPRVTTSVSRSNCIRKSHPRLCFSPSRPLSRQGICTAQDKTNASPPVSTNGRTNSEHQGSDQCNCSGQFDVAQIHWVDHGLEDAAEAEYSLFGRYIRLLHFLRETMKKRTRKPVPPAVKRFEPGDYSVVVKNTARDDPNPWRWEIYRAGRSNPVEQAATCFETMTKAHRAGRDALKCFLDKYYG